MHAKVEPSTKEQQLQQIKALVSGRLTSNFAHKIYHKAEQGNSKSGTCNKRAAASAGRSFDSRLFERSEFSGIVRQTLQNNQPRTNKQKGALHTETKTVNTANATHIKTRTNAYLQILEPTFEHWQTINQHTETINQIQNLAANTSTTQDPVTFQQLETQIQTLLSQTQAQTIWREATQKLQQILNQTGIINPEAYTEQIIKKTQNNLKRLAPIAPESQHLTPDTPQR